jgi:hypothetical protein
MEVQEYHAGHRQNIWLGTARDVVPNRLGIDLPGSPTRRVTLSGRHRIVAGGGLSIWGLRCCLISDCRRLEHSSNCYQ